MNRLYGTEPVLIFDPTHHSNRPDPTPHRNALDNARSSPQLHRDLFTTPFTDGIRGSQNGRVRESEWRAAMARLGDAIVYCPGCRTENFCDTETARNYAPNCWACSKTIRLPVRLQ